MVIQCFSKSVRYSGKPADYLCLVQAPKNLTFVVLNYITTTLHLTVLSEAYSGKWLNNLSIPGMTLISSPWSRTGSDLYTPGSLFLEHYHCKREDNLVSAFHLHNIFVKLEVAFLSTVKLTFLIKRTV